MAEAKLPEAPPEPASVSAKIARRAPQSSQSSAAAIANRLQSQGQVLHTVAAREQAQKAAIKNQGKKR